jgi:hypothetical protein
MLVLGYPLGGYLDQFILRFTFAIIIQYAQTSKLSQVLPKKLYAGNFTTL